MPHLQPKKDFRVMNETFWTLLRNQAHWEFEIFLMLLFDGVIAGVCWPFLRKHWSHHIARDNQDETRASTSVVDNGDTIAECFSCVGPTVLLDTSVVICKECGHVTVPSK